jgi:hypothetical protein
MPIRILSLIVSFLVVASLATATLFYLEQWAGQSRIQVQDEWLMSSDEPVSEPAAYRSYGR